MPSQPTPTGPTQGTQPVVQTPQQKAQQLQTAVNELSGGVAALLKSLGLPYTQALQPFANLVTQIISLAVFASSAVGVVGVIGSAANLAGTLVGLLTGSGSSNPNTQQVSLLNNIQQQLTQIGQTQRADDIKTAQASIQSALVPTYNVLSSFSTLVSELPGLDGQLVPTMENLTTALYALAPPPLSDNENCFEGPMPGASNAWWMAYNDQTFWTDANATNVVEGVVGTRSNGESVFGPNGYGNQAPGSNLQVNGSVFNYIWALPAYTWTVSTFLGVGAVLDPNLTGTSPGYGGIILSVICSLQSVHDYILSNGFVQLSPGQFDQQTLTQWSTAKPMPMGTQIWCIADPTLPATNNSVAVGIQIQYGWVEMFSGYSSVAIQSFAAPFVASYDYYGLLQIRLLARYKGVYVGTGLNMLRTTINQMKKLMGQPVTGNSPADWSIRNDVCSCSPQLTRSDGTVHFQDLLKFMNLNQPYVDANGDPLFTWSVRGALNA